ncbi:MAG: hypothetical protein HUJ29_00990 [Gammaproteobacteria bacterium]|nr:hypothetical protein [Gammaproteobacteria bacterium]
MSSPSQNALYLALDQGGHGSRAIVFDARGKKRVESHCSVESRVEGERVELEAEALVASLIESAESACRQLGEARHQIEAVGLATQRSNIACWARDTGEPLSPIISWQDRRAPDKLKGLDHQTVHDATGLFPNPHYGASKMAWCLQHLESVQAAAEGGGLMLGPMASYLAARLTGAPALADPANASRTLLWNIHSRDWDAELCRHFSIERSWLPACTDSRAEFGQISILDLALPLRVVTGDLSAAAFARGRPDPDTAYVTVGTGGFVQRLTRQLVDGAERLLNGMVWADGEDTWYSLEGTVNGAGSALSWLAREQGVEEATITRQLATWCDDIEPESVFLNGVSGLGSPYWRGDFPSRFVDGGDLSERAVAVVESIVFLLVDNLRAMDEVMPPAQSLVIGGGLSQVDGFCQRLADLARVPVRRSGEREGTAKGLACLLAGQPEAWQSVDSTRFEPGQGEGIRRRYRRWREQMDRALAESA